MEKLINKYLGEKKQPFWKTETDYIIRELSPNEFQISKWMRGDTPDAIYSCYDRGSGKWVCTCPARDNCVHIKEVKKWVKEGKKNPLDKEGIKEFEKLVKKFS